MSENERDADMIRMLTQILASAQGRPALGRGDENVSDHVR